MKYIFLSALVAAAAYMDATAELRTWTTTNGKTVEAELTTTMGGQAVLKDAKGAQHKIPLSSLSAEDQKYIELTRPPKFTVTFIKQTNQRTLMPSPYFDDREVPVFDYVFSAKVAQSSSGAYNHELKIEFFAIGKEIAGDRYILLDRQESAFIPSKENDTTHRFSGNPVEIMTYKIRDYPRGRQFSGNLVTVTDERGEIIAYNASSEWLLTNIENFRQLPIGAYFDETCTRCYPTPPKSWY